MHQSALEIIRTYISGNEIRKAKKYLKPGQKPPAGVQVHTGPRKGMYYNTEDVHTARGTTPKKRLPAFRMSQKGNLEHNTKSGTHGPGTYSILDTGDTNHLMFTPKGAKSGESQLIVAHKDVKELKKLVSKFKDGGASKPSGTPANTEKGSFKENIEQLRKDEETFYRQGDYKKSADARAKIEKLLKQSGYKL